jgi:hypothetical protein
MYIDCLVKLIRILLIPLSLVQAAVFICKHPRTWREEAKKRGMIH